MNLLSALLSLRSPVRLPVRGKPASRRGAAAVLAAVLLATACGSGGIEVADVRTETTERPTVPAIEPTAVPAGDTVDTGPEDGTNGDPDTGEDTTDLPAVQGRIDSIQGVAAATVKIIAEGVFVPPLELEENRAAGIGTGFIIDPSGLMVTNNHVVTGAAFVEVYLEGSSNPTNARLLGVSECNDLAVLDLEGDGYDYLEFRTSMDDVGPGLPVFAAGYPALFDTDFLAVDYTLTGGIVNTTTASGASNFSSVDSVIEHDARIRGGNSGGPLVDEQGRVVGINYAGEDSNDLNLAIDALAAWPIIEELQNGDVEALGINGQAIVTDGVSGIWVSAVESGTPADGAGLIAGDFITTMEGLPMGANGTLEDYCDIIRTNGPDDALSIEVLRLGTEELLSGQINGTPLTQSFSFAEELADEMVDTGDTTTQAAAGYSEYEFVSDDTNSVGVEVPVEWIERNGSLNPDFGESIFAAPDLTAFLETFDVPGVIVERSTNFTAADIDTVLDDWGVPDCPDRGGREDFATPDGVFTGRWEAFTGCGANGAALLVIAVSPADGNSVVRMLFQIVSDADLEAADRAIASFDSVS